MRVFWLIVPCYLRKYLISSFNRMYSSIINLAKLLDYLHCLSLFPEFWRDGLMMTSWPKCSAIINKMDIVVFDGNEWIFYFLICECIRGNCTKHAHTPCGQNLVLRMSKQMKCKLTNRRLKFLSDVIKSVRRASTWIVYKDSVRTAK